MIAKKKRLPAVVWRRSWWYPNGAHVFESGDTMFRLVESDNYEGIPLSRDCKLWQFKRGRWVRIAEGRSRARIEKIARQRAAELDEDDD